MGVKLLVDDYRCGTWEENGRSKRLTLVYLADSYANWQDEPGMPQMYAAYGGDEYPADPDLLCASRYAVGIGFDPDSGETLKYPKAKVTVVFSTDPQNDVTLSRMEACAEMWNVPLVAVFNTTGAPLDSPLLISVPMINYIIPRRGLLSSWAITVDPKLGAVNSDAWNPEGISYAAGTVFFAGYGKNRIWSPEAVTLQDEVEYKFIIKPAGWQTAWEPTLGAWDTVTPRPYPEVSFAGFPP